jgi:hypothetical protein
MLCNNAFTKDIKNLKITPEQTDINFIKRLSKGVVNVFIGTRS